MTWRASPVPARLQLRILDLEGVRWFDVRIGLVNALAH